MPGKSSVPERWEKYKACGTRIPDTPFVAFKVPIHQRWIDNYVSSKTDEELEECQDLQWTVTSLLKELPEVDVVIDLTYTYKYYRPYALVKEASLKNDKAIEYQKLKTQGHVVPENRVVARFFQIVDGAVSKDKSTVIGVHCTHGVNRTGYLVCRYLIQKLKWDPDQALSLFADHRGHPVERKNYIDDLKKANWEPLEEVPPEELWDLESNHRASKRKKSNQERWKRKKRKYEGHQRSEGYNDHPHRSEERFGSNQGHHSSEERLNSQNSGHHEEGQSKGHHDRHQRPKDDLESSQKADDLQGDRARLENVRDGGLVADRRDKGHTRSKGLGERSYKKFVKRGGRKGHKN